MIAFNICDYPGTVFLTFFGLTFCLGVSFGYWLAKKRIEWLKSRLYMARLLGRDWKEYK